MHTCSLTLLAICLSASQLSARTPRQERLRLQSTLQERIETSHTRLQELFSYKHRQAGHDFRAGNVHLDEFGQTHVRFDQYFQGLKVWGAEAITHMGPDRSFLPETLALHPDIRLNTTPTLSSSEVLALVHQEMSPKGTYSSDPLAELVIFPEMQSNQHPFHTPEGSNALETERLIEGYRLAYHVHLELDNAQDGVIQQNFLVEAHRGNILLRWSSLQTLEAAVGKGHSQHSGTVKLDTAKTAAGFELRDTKRGSLPHPKTKETGNITYNAEHGTVISPGAKPGSIYTSQGNSWGDGVNYDGVSTTSANGQTAAVDAAYGLQVTWDMYANVYDRNGIDGKGTSTYSRVHFYRQYDNAFWENSCFCMTYGDGSPKLFAVLTPLDVVAHEMSHGVCFSTANLIYRGESGGLNEANSDILGTMGEFYGKGGGFDAQADEIPETGGNWAIGEQLSRLPLRYMHKPSKDGRSPDAWHPGIGDIDVHFSSGPMNRAFYFLAQGATVSGDTSAPKFLPKGMKGIGNTNASKIWYRAMTAYLPKSANYKEARTACLRAVKDIDSFRSFRGTPVTQNEALAAVQNAFAGVNVGFDAEQSKDLTAPAVGAASLKGNSGKIDITVKATDNVGVTLVEYYVDGILLGSVQQAKDSEYLFNLEASLLANGHHTLLIKAYDAAGNVGCSPDKAEMGFEIKNTPHSALNNGGFELGNHFWDNLNVKFDASKANAHSGNGSAILGGLGNSTECGLAQVIQQPLTAKQLTLTFWTQASTTETGDKAVDFLKVFTADKDETPESLKLVYTLSNLDAGSGYVQKTVALDPAAFKDGGELLFKSEENLGNPTIWRLDDISVVVE